MALVEASTPEETIINQSINQDTTPTGKKILHVQYFLMRQKYLGDTDD